MLRILLLAKGSLEAADLVTACLGVEVEQARHHVALRAAAHCQLLAAFIDGEARHLLLFLQIHLIAHTPNGRAPLVHSKLG